MSSEASRSMTQRSPNELFVNGLVPAISSRGGEQPKRALDSTSLCTEQ